MYVISVRARRGVCADPRPEIVCRAPQEMCVRVGSVRAGRVRAERGVCTDPRPDCV
jgi:hypothetical protein